LETERKLRLNNSTTQPTQPTQPTQQQASNQKPNDNIAKLEAEVARLRNELEAEKKKSPHVTQPNQPNQPSQAASFN
jgi:hypothetical protein